ncbi:MAG: chemotaxis response regulator protein-glutamate methylesterase [Pseudobdellovibrionaceae bacterium]|jgi:two-component system chemotaxis response regulator CheB|nr:chemotaxis response regulator protein-glutamate methylesterase [Pseudobdellovibrionaceae bacterium]
MSKTSTTPLKVMIVDDSAVIRGFLGKMLESEPAFEVLSTAANGQNAVTNLQRQRHDLILLDVEMPVMDGLTAIPLLLQAQPDIRIIMCSTLTTENAETTMRALSLGAVDCIAKPSTTQDIYAKDTFRNILTHTLRGIGGVSQNASPPPLSQEDKHAVKDLPHRRPVKESAPTASTSTAASSSPATAQTHVAIDRSKKTFTLRQPNQGYTGKPEILAIGSSTGGPNALFELIPNFKGIQIPIIITQHMPPTFTRILAEHIEQQTGVKAVEGAEGMPLLPGRIHIAPGGYHMLLKKNGPSTVITLNDGPMENFCRPAVDPMFRSAIKIYGEKIMAVILTGMGQDGMLGARDVIAAGGRVIAQDEATSIVWGMPGAVALDGSCSAVLPLKEIGPWLRKSSLRLA